MSNLLRRQKGTFLNTLTYTRLPIISFFTVKATSTEKTLKSEKIALVENDTTISEENEIAEIFWSYFDGIVNGLNIKR